MSLGYGWILMKIFGIETSYYNQDFAAKCCLNLIVLFVFITGAVPGGILFGIVIDSTCILWKTDCGVQQTCLRYSSHQLTYAMFGLGENFLL